MQIVRALLTLLALLCLWPQYSAAENDSIFVPSLNCVGGPYGLALTTDARNIRKLGKVLREDVNEIEQGDGYTATWKTIYFAGMSLGVVEFSNDTSHLMVTFAELTSPKWNRISPFKLGKPVSEARALLGEIAVKDPKLKKTYVNESNSSIQIHSSNGIVMGVSYSCYSG